MIREIEGSILTNIQPFSVIMHQCNAKGWMGAGIAKEIAKKWPKAYDEYRKYCAWFKDGHEHEILGTFVGVKVKQDLIICNAIAQTTVSKSKQMTDYNAWETICSKIERQTRYINTKSPQKWSIHIPYKIGCGLGGGDWEVMSEIFYKYFNESPVELVCHNYI